MTKWHLSKWMCVLVVLGLITLVPLAAANVLDGRTPGFWSNRNGARVITVGDLNFLNGLNLVNADGSPFDTSYPALKEVRIAELQAWLLERTAVNMANMLSAQLAAMELNKRHDYIYPTSMVKVYAPGTLSANADGVVILLDVIHEAEVALAADGYTPAGVRTGTTRKR